MSDEKVKSSSSGGPPAGTAGAGGGHKDMRHVHRFRVGWHADVVFPDQSGHQGFINDISTQGASVFLGETPSANEAELHIHIPPLVRNTRPHVIVISGRLVYSVYDGDKQQFRAAYMFSRFHDEADRAYLGERLSKYQIEIQEPYHFNIVEL